MDNLEEMRRITARTARKNLALLIRLRWIAILGQIAAIAVTHSLLDLSLPLGRMIPVSMALVVLNLISVWWLRHQREIGNRLILWSLLLDVAALTILLYLSGGASNPFVTLFILQVILGVVLLPPGLAFIVMLATVAAFFWLLGNGRPLILPMPARGLEPSFMDLHLQGMFLGFVMAAGLLFRFMLSISENLRQRDNQIAHLRRQLIEEDHLVRLGLLASGAAHEIGTPLTTVAVTLDDWQTQGLPPEDELRLETARMLGEVARCRAIVSDMLMSSGQERLDEAGPELIEDFLEDLVADWQASDPTLAVTIEADEAESVLILADPMLENALRNLLDNAVEAGARRLTISARPLGDDRVQLRLADDGPGFPPEIIGAPGHPFQSSHEDPGRGLGLFLVSNVMRRIGGAMSLENPASGGAAITLEIQSL
ncbi:ATP-binding protein [Paracoccus aminophilus]|uniref:histidine kinase n=1 Tax=Paracoccus aminophilus JCM 7686 TaxID=1367847 RepID=S5XTG8_PARAH|nr:ATP-binding protein [Paracoccus aminophilus]AGT08472.1 two-component sensor histidine protein kinase [Paracoccus aminophilus JCM 7686]